jgi:concentrative nucleoside transporter, CNT family
VLGVYISFGVPAQNLITASMMSIPASIAISRVRFPEMDEPVTQGRVVVDRGEVYTKNAPIDALHAFSKGFILDLILAGQAVGNVLAILSLVAMIDGLLTWIGRGFGIHQLTLLFIPRYIFYLITFLLGK